MALAHLIVQYGGKKKKKASNKVKKLARDRSMEKFSGQFAWFGNELRSVDGPNFDAVASLRADFWKAVHDLNPAHADNSEGAPA